MRALLLVALTASVAWSADVRPPNVLMIAVDDLRPELGCYGEQRAVTPNLDALARRSMLFERAYCMVPTCGASRAALLSGLRPRRDRFVTFRTRASEDAPHVTTLNTHFKEHGYTTLSLGKIFHHPDDNADGWSEPAWRPKAPMYVTEENLQRARNNPGRRKYGAPYEAADVPDTTYRDGQVAEQAVRRLGELATGEQPFFLAVGFFKPHLPFVAPQTYWDHYPDASVRMPENYFVPQGAPDIALHNSGELRAYAGVPKQGLVPEPLAKKLIQGYHAATSYTDAQIGKVLGELERLGLEQDTIIVLWGDHGWNLGEHTLWCKHSCFETSMRSVLMVRAPGLKGFQPGRTTALTEYIDLYPTLCDLAGLPKPEHLQGASAVPVLVDPQASVKDAAVGRFRTGDTIRTDRYRFSLYRDSSGKEQGRMLYDHQNDPGENVNLAGQPEMAALERELLERLEAAQPEW